MLGWGKTALWVDARSAKEYDAEHLPGAILLNLEDWDNLFPSFLEQWQPDEKIMVYCSSTACQLSHEVAQRLNQSGISSVFVLKGGWEAWKSKKCEPKQASRRTSEVEKPQSYKPYCFVCLQGGIRWFADLSASSSELWCVACRDSF